MDRIFTPALYLTIGLGLLALTVVVIYSKISPCIDTLPNTIWRLIGWLVACVYLVAIGMGFIFHVLAEVEIPKLPQKERP